MRSEDAVTAEAKAALKKKQDEVARAESILIVGGGPVGIEL
jgi:NADH dehydrogenase FAD-containing subunit